MDLWIKAGVTISIHALRTESDLRLSTSNTSCCNFNPRSP